ncbi:MAG: twin-arginine translocation signal domain-containing protein, partial [Haloarculaceae archaeon]
MNRRDFLRTAGGATTATAVAAASSGPAAAQEGGGGGGGQPDFGNWLDQTSNFDGSTADKRGS